MRGRGCRGEEEASRGAGQDPLIPFAGFLILIVSFDLLFAAKGMVFLRGKRNYRPRVFLPFSLINIRNDRQSSKG